MFKDKLFISNYETKDITELNDVSFLFSNNLRIESYPGIIGLKLVENDIRNVKSFPDQLNVNILTMKKEYSILVICLTRNYHLDLV